jgi:hypothetical protein
MSGDSLPALLQYADEQQSGELKLYLQQQALLAEQLLPDQNLRLISC